MSKIFGFLTLIGIILINSCKTVEVTTTTATQAVAKAGLVLQPFTQRYIRDVTQKDSANWMNKVSVYNSSPIELSLFIYDKNKSLTVDDNGDSHKGGQNIDLLATVPQTTPGKKSSPKFGEKIGETQYPPWVITSYLVSFDLSDQTFTFNFKRTTNGAFILDPRAKIIYQEKEYDNVKPQNKGGKDCILLFYGEENQNTLKIRKVAQGVKSSAPIKGGESTEPVEQKPDEDIW